jgi:hypothetical protein
MDVPPPLLFLLHRLAAASQLAVTSLGDDHLRAALETLVPFAYLVRQIDITPRFFADSPLGRVHGAI